MKRFTTDDLIACYRRGVFPMGESRTKTGLYLVDPDWRLILPLQGFHVPRRLARTIRAGHFRFSIDRDFAAVIDGCAASTPDREDTWINSDIRHLYLDMHRRGFAHSVETWADDKLVGGLYGVSLGGAFFGESMFSRADDASKAALVHLVARLRYGGHRLLDAQFANPHLDQFGAELLARADFHARLAEALRAETNFSALPVETNGADLLALI